MFEAEHTVHTYRLASHILDLSFCFKSIFLAACKSWWVWIRLMNFVWCGKTLTYLSSLARFPTLLRYAESILFFLGYLYGGSEEYFWVTLALWRLSASLTRSASMGWTTKPSAVGSLLRNSLITPSSLPLISSNNTASQHRYVRLSNAFRVALIFCACDFTSTFYMS